MAFETNPAMFGYDGQVKVPTLPPKFREDWVQEELFIPYELLKRDLHSNREWATFRQVDEGRLVYLAGGYLIDENTLNHYKSFIHSIKLGDEILNE